MGALSAHGADSRRARPAAGWRCARLAGPRPRGRRPTSKSSRRDYDGWYRPASGRFSGGGDVLLRMSRGRLARRLDHVAPPGPVLDVGCGDGALLDGLAARGREALGLERVATRPDVRACAVDGLRRARGEWAAVVFWHTLEHVMKPAAALDRACELLAPGGLLAIAVPNLASWQARMFGDRWLHLDLPRHLVHLPAAALVDRLRARGLEIDRVSYWRGGQVVFGWLHGLVAALARSPQPVRRDPAAGRAVAPDDGAAASGGRWRRERRSPRLPSALAARRGRRQGRRHRLR